MKLDPEKHNYSDKIHTDRDRCTGRKSDEVNFGCFQLYGSVFVQCYKESSVSGHCGNCAWHLKNINGKEKPRHVVWSWWDEDKKKTCGMR